MRFAIVAIGFVLVLHAQQQAPAPCLDRPAAERPYTRVRLLALVSDQGPSRAEYLIRTCGVRVPFTAELAADLKEAGAEENVIRAVRDIAPAPEPPKREPERVEPAVRIPAAPVFDVNATFAKAQQLFNKEDYSGALPLLRQCADARHSDAMHLMGWFYQNGFGVAQDYHAALDWYRRAAELGVPASMNNLGFLYQNGQGVVQDYGTAMQWYLRAAGKGLAISMNQIGILYENGLGVPKNRDDALAWYRQAANLGFDAGKKNVTRLEAVAAAAPTPVNVAAAPPMKKRRISPNPELPARPAPPEGVVAGNLNGEPSLQFQVSYYCRNTLMFGQVSTCGTGTIIVDQQSVSFRGTGDCQAGDACGALSFTGSKAKSTLKFEGGREGDTVSIYFNGHRQRFGNLKADTPFMLLLRRAFDDFSAAYSSVR
ncbi:MAG TPA: tetratricopeptide repeat protein [Bryobacteraceae bacterium]|jgi:hypothetical protein